MCRCNPSIRTPFCGKGTCRWPDTYPLADRPADAVSGYVLDPPLATTLTPQVIAAGPHPRTDPLLPAAGPHLFRWGDFSLHSGGRSPLKIDCDALCEADWQALAWAALTVLPPFAHVEGVPQGGLALAAALRRYCRPQGTLLIVDDVLTTGASMEERRGGREAEGFVVFARNMPPPWVRALFRMGVAL